MPADTLTVPAHMSVPPHVGSAGPDAADLAASAGLHLDVEQRLVLDSILAERPDGRWAAFEAAVIMARQNGKSRALEALVLADLFLFGADLVVWTAHVFATTMEAFRDIKALIGDADHLRRRVKKVSEANGEEAIELIGGQRILFRARSKTAGRGISGDRVIFDEAFALGPAHMGSLLPTLSARPNPQVVYASSAGRADSTVLRAVRDRGRAGGDPTLAYLEWAAPVVPCDDSRCDHRPGQHGCALDDEDAWQHANPAMGRRITRDHVAAERRALPPEEFARERLGWWEEPTGGQAGLPLNLWEASVWRRRHGRLLAVAVDVTPDLAFASVAAAWSVPDGALLTLAAHGRGTGWVPDEVARLRGEAPVPVVVDSGGPACVVAADLTAAGVVPVAPGTKDVAQGCAALLNGLVCRTVWHKPAAELDAAVRGASRRPLGDQWAWSRRNSLADISPLVAVTLALWGAQRPPGRAEVRVYSLADHLTDET